MLTFLKTLILAVVLAGITFMGYCTWKYKGIAYNELVYLLRKWRGRQVSSVKDRVKRKIKLILLLLAVSASLSYAKPNTATEVQGVHNGKFTPVPESQVVPIIVKQSTEYVGPTATPTPTFTWNATTTPTQPPTSTPTATNTPYMVKQTDEKYEYQAVTLTINNNTAVDAITFSRPHDTWQHFANYDSSGPTTFQPIFRALTSDKWAYGTAGTTGSVQTTSSKPSQKIVVQMLGTVTPGPVTVHIVGYDMATR